MLEAGLMVMTAFISPFRKDRDLARSLVKAGDFIEIYCAADLVACETRDPKGLYKKARAGQIPEFTGITSPYEEPLAPELVLETGRMSVDESVEQLFGFLREKEYLVK